MSEQAKPIADNPGLSSAITVGSVHILCCWQIAFQILNIDLMIIGIPWKSRRG